MKTYTPIFSRLGDMEDIVFRTTSIEALERRAKYPFERAALDRLVAIYLDMEVGGLRPGLKILDVGASSGFFSLGFATLGYRVLSVENDVASSTQGTYPASAVQLFRESLALEPNRSVALHDGDFFDFIARTEETWDVVLLLSVVHQWHSGYAMSGKFQRDLTEISAALSKLARKTREGIYYEMPIEEPINERLRHIGTVPWFLEVARARSFHEVGLSTSADGDIRRLVFIETQ